MLKNYFIVAFRSLFRDKFYSAINILGLALGITCCLLIMIYISDEISYDRMHSKADRIYRINEFMVDESAGERSSSLPFPVGPTLNSEFPSIVETQVRFFDYQSPSLMLENKETNKAFNETRIFFVDSTFFDVFDFELVKGDKETALDEPNSLLITETMAKKYFGNQDPVGKILRFQAERDLIVKGILADTPLNTHFQFDFIGSMSTVRQSFNGRLPRTWYWNPCWTYLVLKDGSTPADLEELFPDFILKFFPEFLHGDVVMRLQALTDIHLTSDLEFEIQPNSSENNVYVFSIIGGLILFIACFNYMNLSTAKSAKRSKEVGIRKTLGSKKRYLVTQFLLESIIITGIAVLVSLLFFWIILPSFNAFTEKSIGFAMLIQPQILLGLLAVVLLIGIGAGIYPAFVLSSFSPIKGLKGEQKGKGGHLRQTLVILQFSISIIMIIGTSVATSQLDFLRQSDTGFDKEQVLYVSALRTPIAQKYEAFKNEILRRNDIKHMTAVVDALGARHQGDNFRFEGMERSTLFSVFWSKHDFFKTFGLDIVQGRPFKENILSDDTAAIVINQAMCKRMKWRDDEAVGKPFEYGRRNGKIIGVVEDFNFASKHRNIEPLVLQLRNDPRNFNLLIKYLAIKLDTENMKETLAFIEDKWNHFAPGRPFDYFFLEDELNTLYKDEDKLSKVASLFSGLAIVVACLGLFALASFTAEQRKKEIAVRKVLGSTIPQVILLLSKDFTKLITIAFVIACPLAYLSIDSWLNNFAFRIGINPLAFIIAGFGTLVIALITISFQSLKAASANPSTVLKYE
ncbi:MAG: ABC transporter permease [Reichenbachiella sp.]|uniref:ABC transporter permease n=1 Tax=Reichenbachiella sp. TaxID=2184521 RepID=UPI003266511F